MSTQIQDYKLAQKHGVSSAQVKEGATMLSCKWISSLTQGLVGVAVYASVDTAADDEERIFHLLETGADVPAASTFVGSVEDDEDNLYHVYVENVVP